MKQIEKYVTNLELGKPQYHKNIAVVPLLGKDSGLDYLVFDEAVNSGLEVSETGSVPTLHFKNKTDKEVLIMLGEYVQGGKQNRMVATNVYMAKDFDGDVPVNCVEHHRWTSGAPVAFRAPQVKAARSVSYASLQGQNRVWDEVSCLSADLNVGSATGDYGEATVRRKKDTDKYTSKIKYVPESVGMVIVTQKNGKKLYSCDIFDQSSTLEKNFNKLVESYALEALVGGDDIKKQPKNETKEFLARIRDCEFNERKAVSLGRDFKMDSSSVEGLALSYKGTPLYVSFGNKIKRKTDVGPRMPEIFNDLDQIRFGHIRTGIVRRF